MLKRRMILVVSAFLVIPSSRSWAAPPREGYVPVEGGPRLHYREIGHGKPTVIIPSDAGWGTRAGKRGRRRGSAPPRPDHAGG